MGTKFSTHGGIRIKSKRGGDQPVAGLMTDGYSNGSNGCTPVACARVLADNPDDEDEINDLAPICAEYLGTDRNGSTPHRHPKWHLDRINVGSHEVNIEPSTSALWPNASDFPTVAQLCRALGRCELDFEAALLHTRGHSACIVDDRAYQCGARHRVRKLAIVSEDGEWLHAEIYNACDQWHVDV